MAELDLGSARNGRTYSCMFPVCAPSNLVIDAPVTAHLTGGLIAERSGCVDLVVPVTAHPTGGLIHKLAGVDDFLFQ
jgi:hypothetical protein